MTDLFSTVDTAAGTAFEPAPLPEVAISKDGRTFSDLAGQLERGDLTLANLAGLFALWPATVTETPYDPETESPTDLVMTLDRKAKTVAAVRGKRALTAEEVAARKPPPAILGKVEFITLVQMAGGMTDAMLVQAHADANFAAFWIKFQMAAEVQRDYPTTAGALDALAASGYMPNGKDAVLAAWPTA